MSTTELGMWSIFDDAERWHLPGCPRKLKKAPMYGISFNEGHSRGWPHDTIRLVFPDGSALDRPYSWYLYTRYVLLGRRRNA